MKNDAAFILLIFIVAASCTTAPATNDTGADNEIITPVTITSLSADPMIDYLELNATSTFLKKSYVKAPANGYITSVNAQVGITVTSTQSLFNMKTKEAQSIGNAISALDTSFRFSGVISIKGGVGGYVSEVSHQLGDYVQEGEQLAVINDTKSLVFILNLPYELRPYVLNKKSVDLLLPDGKRLQGVIAAAMPVVDSASQTQNIIIRVNETAIPTNLIAKVRIEKNIHPSAVSLPKQSLLSDETQSIYWVMKLTDSITAVKIRVTKGLEINDRVEILSPQFMPSDKFILTGNFGLADTARIRIIQQ